MSTTFETLLFEVDEQGICTITFNRPEKLNALNNQVIIDLENAIQKVESDQKIRVLILTGAGEKSFVAGADIKEFVHLDEEKAIKLSERGQSILKKIEDLTIPVIAAINGFALGGGLELAMACHIRIASIDAKLGLPEITLGLIPGYGGTQRLVKYVGQAKAIEMIATGKFIDAEEAKKIGLLNQVEESAYEASKKLAIQIVKQAPIALKNAIFAIKSAGTEKGYQQESKLFGDLFNTEDFKEGVTAFIEKRKPNFSGK